MEVRVPPPCLFFSFLGIQSYAVVVPSVYPGFPRRRGSASTQKGIFVCSLCPAESPIRANETEKVDKNNIHEEDRR